MMKTRKKQGYFKMRRFNADYKAMSNSTCDPVIVLLGTNKETIETVYEAVIPSAESRRLSRPVDPPYYVKEDISGSFPSIVLPPVVDETSQKCHERPLKEIVQKVIELFGEIHCFLFIWNAAEVRFGLDEKALFENLKKTVGSDAVKDNTVMLMVNANVLLKTDRLNDFLRQRGNESLQSIHAQLGGRIFDIRDGTNYQEIIQSSIRAIITPVTRTLYPYPCECLYQSFLILRRIVSPTVLAVLNTVTNICRRCISFLFKCK